MNKVQWNRTVSIDLFLLFSLCLTKAIRMPIFSSVSICAGRLRIRASCLHRLAAASTGHRTIHMRTIGWMLHCVLHHPRFDRFFRTSHIRSYRHVFLPSQLDCIHRCLQVQTRKRRKQLADIRWTICVHICSAHYLDSHLLWVLLRAPIGICLPIPLDIARNLCPISGPFWMIRIRSASGWLDRIFCLPDPCLSHWKYLRTKHRPSLICLLEWIG